MVDKVRDKTLTDWGAGVKRGMGGKHVTLIIYNYEAYFKKDKNAQGRVRAAKVRGVEPSKKDVATTAMSRWYL